MPRSPSTRGRQSDGGQVSVAEWNRAREFLGPITAEPPLYVTRTASGTHIRSDVIPSIRARVVSYASGIYQMHQVDRSPTGAWIDLPFTFAAKEYNGLATVPVGWRVDADYFRTSNEWLFRGSTC